MCGPGKNHAESKPNTLACPIDQKVPRVWYSWPGNGRWECAAQFQHISTWNLKTRVSKMIYAVGYGPTPP